MSDDCDFLSANMYARKLYGNCRCLSILCRNVDIFRPIGKDALANLSVEKTSRKPVTSLVVSAFVAKSMVHFYIIG
jgi:hypothetical protein